MGIPYIGGGSSGSSGSSGATKTITFTPTAGNYAFELDSSAGRFLLGYAAGSLVQFVLPADNTITLLQVEFAGLSTLDISALTDLQYLTCSNNELTTLNISACQNLRRFEAQSNLFSQAVIDALLAQLVTHGVVDSDAYAYLSGGSNAVPSAAGLTSKATLESRGWEVLVNT